MFASMTMPTILSMTALSRTSRPVALDHVQLLGKVNARGALRSRQIRTGVHVCVAASRMRFVLREGLATFFLAGNRGQCRAIVGNSGQEWSLNRSERHFLRRRSQATDQDRSFEGFDAERVQVDHGELVCAVGHDQGGRHHARGVVAGGADVATRDCASVSCCLASPVQLSNADRRRDVRPRGSGQQPRGSRVLRSLLDDVGWQGRDAQSQGRQNRRRAAVSEKSCS